MEICEDMFLGLACGGRIARIVSGIWHDAVVFPIGLNEELDHD